MPHTSCRHAGVFYADEHAYPKLVIYIGACMRNSKAIIKGGFILSLIMFASACVVSPREGYYDRDNHRYYHERAWHECGEHDHYCN
jgi:hypothetical protein